MQNNIYSLLIYLQSNPSIIDKSITYLSTKIIESNKDKRYTEFYKIKAIYKSNYAYQENYFWIRIIKNKPSEQIQKSLCKQFAFMKKIYPLLTNEMANGLQLSCSKPIAVLPDFAAVITMECSGRSLNKYLQYSIPQMSRHKIVKHCYSCGVLLKKLHRILKKSNISPIEYNTLQNRFRRKYRKNPSDSMDYITVCHNDYTPRNIFVDTNLVEVIDFADSSLGFPEQDIYTFCQYVKEAKFNYLYSTKMKRSMSKWFLRGYHRGSEEGWGGG